MKIRLKTADLVKDRFMLFISKSNEEKKTFYK